MITDDIHCYGAKGLDGVYISSLVTDENSLKKVVIDVIINDSEEVLSSAECNAVKIALPGSAKDVTVTPDSNTGYLRLSATDKSINYRLYDKNTSTANDQFTSVFTFYMTPEDYENEYGSFAKYFISPDSTDSAYSATFNDDVTPGIYNNR